MARGAWARRGWVPPWGGSLRWAGTAASRLAGKRAAGTGMGSVSETVLVEGAARRSRADRPRVSRLCVMLSESERELLRGRAREREVSIARLMVHAALERVPAARAQRRAWMAATNDARWNLAHLTVNLRQLRVIADGCGDAALAVELGEVADALWRCERRLGEVREPGVQEPRSVADGGARGRRGAVGDGRRVSLGVLLSAAERERLAVRSEQLGVPVGRLLVDSALAEHNDRDVDVEVRLAGIGEITTSLREVGGRVNTLAHGANASRVVGRSPRLDETLGESRRLLERVSRWCDEQDGEARL